MKQSSNHDTSRRKFITSMARVCAAACIFKGNNIALAQTIDKNNDQIKHKFDRKYDQEITYRKFFATRYSEFIKLTKALEKEWGKDKLINFLKKSKEERAFNYGQKQAKKIGDNSLAAYVKQFRPPNYQNTLTHEVVVDTDTAFQMKVTECIWAKTFIDAGMGDVGYAHICYGDYNWTKGFNTKLKMERDKTLMQGHDCCNHRYIMIG